MRALEKNIELTDRCEELIAARDKAHRCHIAAEVELARASELQMELAQQANEASIRNSTMRAALQIIAQREDEPACQLIARMALRATDQTPAGPTK
jgi:hypothetical protein